MAGLVKRGAQNPWVQMLIGGLANYTQDAKEEREKQQEYARKLALMDRERRDKVADRSYEQELKQGQDQSEFLQSRYSGAMTAERFGEAGQVAQQLGAGYGGGEGGALEVSAANAMLAAGRKSATETQQATQREILAKLATLNTPEVKAQWLKDAEPIYASSGFDFQGSIKRYQAEANKTTAKERRLNEGKGIFADGPREGEDWVSWMNRGLSAAADAAGTKEYDDLRANFEAVVNKRVATPTAAAEARAQDETPQQKAERDLVMKDVAQGPALMPSPGGAGTPETPQRQIDRIQQQLAMARIVEGVATRPDSLLLGMGSQEQGPPGYPPGFVGPIQTPGAGTAPPPEVAAAMRGAGGPATGATEAQQPPMIPGQRVPQVPPGYGVEAGTGRALTPLTPAMGGASLALTPGLRRLMIRWGMDPTDPKQVAQAKARADSFMAGSQ